MTNQVKFISMILALVIIITGCGERKEVKKPAVTPSPSRTLQVYENKEVGYKLTIPSGWEKVVSSFDGDVMVEYKKAEFEPLPSFNIISTKIKPYDLYNKENQKEIKNEIDKNLKCAEEKNIKISGKPAYLLVYGVEKDKVSVIISQIYVFHKEYLMVLTCGCVEDRFPSIEPKFSEILQAVKFESI